jgi:hypothetical protein
LKHITQSIEHASSYAPTTMEYGVTLPNGCQLTHGQAANVKKPFADIPVEMHELAPGGDSRLYAGQFGIIPFDASLRLPRHVHISVGREQPGPQQDRAASTDQDTGMSPAVTTATSTAKLTSSLIDAHR